MQFKQILKILVINVGIGVVDTIIFSPGLLGVQIGGASALSTAFGVTAIIMSGMIFVFANYNLLRVQEKIISTSKLQTTDDFIDALRKNHSKKTFQSEMNTLLEQIERIQEKQATIREILLQKFNNTEMSYAKFDGAVNDLADVFYLNIKSILNKLNAFDEEDYLRTKQDAAKKSLSTEIIQSKLNIYQEYISFVQNSVEDNEQILFKLDQLSLELTKFHSLEDGELEELAPMKAIDDLISKTKYYKN